jgi:hypothetical protein
MNAPRKFTTAASNPRRGQLSSAGGERSNIIPLHRNAWTAEIERRLRDDRPVHLDIEELRQRRSDQAETDADLRIIGWGLLAGSFFAVIFRMSQLGWLS